MNIYNLMRMALRIRSQRVKLLGIAAFHILRRRYYGVFFDPVLACNFRCKMCYFSDEERRKSLHGTITDADLESMAQAVFGRALKLQVGCGAEPTLYRNLEKVIALGRRYGVPYISLTTNGYLLDGQSLSTYIKAGLNELTLSLHGVTKATYEELMVNGKYERFCQLIDTLVDIKRQYPTFKVRINYTMNADNVEELARLFQVFPHLPVDVLQLRPIQKIGESAYSNFSMQKLFDCYDTVIEPLREECERRGALCIAPAKENLTALQNEDGQTADIISPFTYCYASPTSCWRDDFDFRNENFNQYARRTHILRSMLKEIFTPAHKRAVNTTRKLNYTVS